MFVFDFTKDSQCLFWAVFKQLQVPEVIACANGVRRYCKRPFVQWPRPCQLLIGNEEECKAHADLCRQRIERESLLLSGNGRGQLAKYREQDGRSVQNICVARAQRYGLVEVDLRPSKVKPVNRTHEAASGVTRGQSWSERNGLLCSRKRTLIACCAPGAVRHPELRQRQVGVRRRVAGIQTSRGPESGYGTLIAAVVALVEALLAFQVQVIRRK